MYGMTKWREALMAKFRVQVGGFVSVYRQRTLTVHASMEEEAMEKAVEKFVELQQADGISICDDGNVNFIERVD
jgi:hypothetical protein